MRKIRLIGLLLTALVVISVVTGALAGSRNYRAHLNGGNEVPNPNDSRAQGQAIFKFSKNGDELEYKLIVANIENVTMAHIHLASAPGGTGGIVLWLYPSAPPAQLIPGRFDGVLAEGTVTAANLVGALAGMTLDDLRAAFDAGLAYVNVHTSQFPAGEIRGDIH